MKPVRIKARAGGARAAGLPAHVGEEPQDEAEKIMTSVGRVETDLKRGVARMLARYAERKRSGQARVAGIASAKKRKRNQPPRQPVADWWTPAIDKRARDLRAEGRSDSYIASTPLFRKAGKSARHVCRRIADELGPRPRKK